MKRLLTALSIGLCTTVAWGAAEVGKPAPDFTATDITGKEHRLSDYKGKIVVLESYNYDCPFVANHYKTKAMQDLQAELTAKGVIWLIVNSVHPGHANYRTREAAQKEWNDLGIKATAWLDDSSGAIGKAYGMRTTPHMFVIDKEGILVYAGAIDDRSSSSHDPRKARNYVREAVEKLLAGQKPEVSQTRPYGCSVKYAE
ncbi:MAG: thioredoxin family protein [Verrucomicrobiota bacterium]|nr:thioredoxin family protein [Limisphaera sp.]MDW8381841.1 thioredoxin family protein [Verrucomicrobiota bacterium]